MECIDLRANLCLIFSFWFYSKGISDLQNQISKRCKFYLFSVSLCLFLLKMDLNKEFHCLLFPLFQLQEWIAIVIWLHEVIYFLSYNHYCLVQHSTMPLYFTYNHSISLHTIKLSRGSFSSLIIGA